MRLAAGARTHSPLFDRLTRQPQELQHSAATGREAGPTASGEEFITARARNRRGRGGVSIAPWLCA